MNEVRERETFCYLGSRLPRGRRVRQIDFERIQPRVLLLRLAQGQRDDLIASVEHLPANLRADAGRPPRHQGDITGHVAPPGTSASTRSGLPEPFLILRGAAMMTAPLGGSRPRLVRHCR